jgi:peptidoglycan/xylan/chitin deacetylase (PgdA/CDA1 family)
MASLAVKHRVKMALREVWARLLWHTPLWRLVDRLTPPRLVILAGHALAGPAGASAAAGLGSEMVVEPEALGRLVGALKKRHAFHTVSGGLSALGMGGPRGLVALTFDDGYRDNVELLPALLEEWDVPATVYLESRPLESDAQRHPNWYHRLAWLETRLGTGEVARRFAEAHPGSAVASRFADGRVPGLGELKRVLKYDEEPALVETELDRLFAEGGGDGPALCGELYMDWEGARRLAAAGVEIGGHTATHPVLARLSDDAAADEARSGRERIRAEVPQATLVSFAYPFGRRWDWNEGTAEAVSRAGFENAVTTHAGANFPHTNRLALKRWPLSPETKIHLVAAEACGGFELLRSLGLDLSE